MFILMYICVFVLSMSLANVDATSTTQAAVTITVLSYTAIPF